MMTNTFWTFIALILFLLILVYYKIPAMLKSGLLKRAERISKELEEARRLREEAQQLLAEYQKKRFDAENEANEIIDSAKRQAENIIADMRKATEDYIVNRKKIAEQRIAQAEAAAEKLIHAAAAEKAVDAAEHIMKERLKADKAEGERLFEHSLAEIEKKLKKAS